MLKEPERLAAAMEREIKSGRNSEDDQGYLAEGLYQLYCRIRRVNNEISRLAFEGEEERSSQVEKEAEKMEIMLLCPTISSPRAQQCFAQTMMEAYTETAAAKLANGVMRAHRLLMGGRIASEGAQERLATIFVAMARRVPEADMNIEAKELLESSQIKSEKAWDLLAECVTKSAEAYELLRDLQHKVSRTTESRLVSRICYGIDKGWLDIGHAYTLLKKGKVREQINQEELAERIFRESTSENATYASDLMETEIGAGGQGILAISSDKAQEWLAKTVVNHLDAEAAFMIILGGKVTSRDAWNILAEKVLEDGSPRQKELIARSMSTDSIAQRTTFIVGSHQEAS